MRGLKFIVGIPLIMFFSLLLLVWFESITVVLKTESLSHLTSFIAVLLEKNFEFLRGAVTSLLTPGYFEGEGAFGLLPYILLIAFAFFTYIAVSIFAKKRMSLKKQLILICILNLIMNFMPLDLGMKYLTSTAFYAAAEAGLTLLLINTISASLTLTTFNKILYSVLVFFVMIYALPFLTLPGRYFEIRDNQNKVNHINTAKALHLTASQPVFYALPENYHFTKNSGSQSTYSCQSNLPNTPNSDFIATQVGIGKPGLYPSTYYEHVKNEFGNAVQQVDFVNSDGKKIKAIYDRWNNVLTFYDDYFRYTLRGNNAHDKYNPEDVCSLDVNKLIEIAKSWKILQVNP